jgi:hypothetical protein
MSAPTAPRHYKHDGLTQSRKRDPVANTYRHPAITQLVDKMTNKDKLVFIAILESKSGAAKEGNARIDDW